MFGLANSSDTYLLLYAGLKGIATYQVILLYALFNLAYAISSSPLGNASDRYGSGKILLIGWALFGLSYLLLSRSAGYGLIPVFALYGIAVAATDGVSKAFLVQQGLNLPKGTLIGAHYFVLGLTTLVGNLAAGLIWVKYSPENMLVFGGALSLLSAVGLGSLLISQKQAQKTISDGPEDLPAG